MQAIMPIVFTSLFLDIDDDSPRDTERIGEIKMSISQTSQVFIDSQVYAWEGGLNINWDYVDGLFDEDVITAMFHQNTKLLEAIIRDEEDYVLQPGEKEMALISAYNDTDEDIPATTLQQLFANRVESSPQHTAVEGLDEKITYRELDQRSNQVARYLREQGVKPNDLVGILGERCIDTIVNVMGIIKAGGAYVPVDPEYPEDRKNYILQSSNCSLTIGPDLYQTKKLDAYSREEVNNVNTPEDLAYIIHTSGSTGRPKGVIEKHRAVANTLVDINRRFAVGESDRVMGISSMCFDLSVYDIFGTFEAGAVLVLIRTPKDILHLIDILEDKKITLWNSVPAIMDLAVEELPHDYMNRQLRIVMLSGDWIPLDLPGKIEKHFPGAKTYSLGGATEASIWSIYYPIEEVKSSWKSIPYGVPLANQEFYVLNYNMQLCPVEVVGELYIGGIGLASGYLNDIRKTADSFIYHPQLGSLYRTGDYGVLHKEGYIEFLGRRDQQVKIKGHRIELGEIENQLLKHEGVKAAIAVVRKNADKDISLCAYIVPAYDEAVTISQLKECLLEKLPGYMIPSHFVMLESMPLTANGKINKKALPEPVVEISEDYEAPRDKLEEKLVEIWSGVLAVEKEKLGINDSFFEKGGHSISAIALISKMYKHFNVKLPLGELFKTPTIKEISQYLKKAAKGKYSEVEEVEKKEYYPMSSQQKGLYFIQKLEPGNISYNMSMVLVLKEDVQRKKLENALKALINRHEGLRTSFEIINDQPVQRVHDDVLFNLEYYQMDEEEAGMTVKGFQEPFDLGIAPLMRAKLIKISKEKCIVLLDLHHIIVDAISNNILISDFSKLYLNRSTELTPLNIQYSNYSQWHLRLSRSGELDRQEAYWLSRFSGELPLLKMTTDFPRPEEKNLEGDRVNLKLDMDLIDKVKIYLRKSETTFYIFVLSVYTILLSKYSGQDDIVVGSPISGRTHPDLYNIIGLFANMLPMRNFPKEDLPFRDFFEEVKNNALNAFENQEYQFTELVSKLNVSKDLSRHPLFDAVLASTTDYTAPGDSLNECFAFELYDYDFSDLKFDLLLDILESEDSMHLDLNYSVSLFKPATAEKILQHLVEILGQVIEDDNIMLKDIKISHELISLESEFPAAEADIFEF
jgi:amino acid adenylation domain-containing protein